MPDQGATQKPTRAPAVAAVASDPAPAGDTNLLGAISATGPIVAEVPVTIGPQFLERFSEHLYSSPNKAFEELVANSWDAGARTVHVGVSTNLQSSSAAVWILDDGQSMDIEGFRDLWAVAVSRKRDGPPSGGRLQIGKFGLGKLATYLLANELTYVCKAGDGIIRAISMDYRQIDAGPAGQLAMSPVELGVRVLSQDQVESLLNSVGDGPHVADLIRSGIPSLTVDQAADDFGVPDGGVPASTGTWTLAILSSLKPAGQAMQVGQIRRLLRTALPLGPSMAIAFNKEVLEPTKRETPIQQEWAIGPGLGIESVEVDDEAVAVSESDDPYPHVTIEGVPGRIAGKVRLYEEKVSGGKSEELGASNGFEINIYGRVIRPTDQYFGLQNLNHAAWAKFRASVRADGLDEFLAVNRETFNEGPSLARFRAFLRALFNKARVAHDAANEAAWIDAGASFSRDWSSVPLEPLKRVVQDGLESAAGLPSFVGQIDPETAHDLAEEWREAQPQDTVADVVLEEGDRDAPLARFDVARRAVVINLNHPFAREHSDTQEEKLLLRDLALVEVLGTAYLLDAGVDAARVEDLAGYKDQLQRLISRMNRRSAATVTEMLLAAVTNEKGLEELSGDSLEYLGFEVTRKGQSGEPEGLAVAPVTPNEADELGRYSFTYDAKSSRHPRVQAKDLNTSALRRHQKSHDAEFTLVIAPDFEVGEALKEQAPRDHVCPMRAQDLAKLLMLAAATGPLDLRKMHAIAGLHDPAEVTEWVDRFISEELAKPRISLGMILRVLTDIGTEGPNAVAAAVIADRIRVRTNGAVNPSRQSVKDVIAGLSVIAPSLVTVIGDNVFLSQHPDIIRAFVVTQIGSLPSAFRFGIDESAAAEKHEANPPATPAARSPRRRGR